MTLLEDVMTLLDDGMTLLDDVMTSTKTTHMALVEYLLELVFIYFPQLQNWTVTCTVDFNKSELILVTLLISRKSGLHFNCWQMLDSVTNENTYKHHHIFRHTITDDITVYYFCHIEWRSQSWYSKEVLSIKLSKMLKWILLTCFLSLNYSVTAGKKIILFIMFFESSIYRNF